MGPLAGLKLIEVAGIGPGPLAAMMLGDMGADVIRVDRTRGTGPELDPRFNVHGRSRRSIAVDLQTRDGAEVILRLVKSADGLMEPFRPGVADIPAPRYHDRSCSFTADTTTEVTMASAGQVC